MQAFFLAILAWLMFPWVFWTLIGILSLVAYKLVGVGQDEDEFSFGALFVTSLIIVGLIYRHDTAWALMTTWPSNLYVVAGYAAVGFGVMSYKWLTLLADFRPKAQAWLETDRNSFKGAETKSKALSEHAFPKRGYCYTSMVTFCETPAGNISYYPNWRMFPLANWLTFWPFFSVSVIFDPLLRLSRRVVKLCGEALEAIAKKFSVS